MSEHAATKYLDQQFLASLPDDLPIDQANRRLSQRRAQRARCWDKWAELLDDEEFEAFLIARDYRLLCVEGASAEANECLRPVEMEQCAIGAILLARDSPQWRDEIVGQALRELHVRHFTYGNHRTIFSALCELERARQIGANALSELCVESVAHRLRQRHQLDAVGGAAYLMACMQECPSAANIAFYIRAIIEASRLRATHELGHALIEYPVQPDASAARIAAFAQNATQAIAESGWCDFARVWNATQK